ncbi:MAG: glycosyltransferase family 9 protein, partial [Pseudomonadota bacterium]
MQADTDKNAPPNKITWQREPQNILLVLPTWVGDVVMATPFIEAAFARFPQARISLLMYRHLQPILHGSPWLEHVYVWPPRKPGPTTSKAQHKADYRDFLHSLKAASFDLAILLPNSLRVAWVAWRIRATRRVGFNRDGRGLLLTDRLPVPNKQGRSYTPMPLVEYYHHLAMYLDM